MDTDTPAKPRLIGYVRVSTHEQAENGSSLEAQENQIRAYCTYKNFELVHIFRDEGESGTTSFHERPASSEMLTRMAELNANGIVITRLDRGFRDRDDCFFTVANLQQRGIALHLLDLPVADLSSPEGELILGVFAIIAQFDNKRRKELQRRSFAVLKANGGRCGTIPYGWVIRPSGSDLLPDQEEQRVLHQIVAWIELSKFGVSKIARLLNTAGTPTKNAGKKWFPASVATVYKHRRLAPLQSEDNPEKEKAA